MHPDLLLRRLSRALRAPQGAKARVRTKVQERIASPTVFHTLREVFTPSLELQRMLWRRILPKIALPETSSLLEQLRELLKPSPRLRGQVRMHITPKLTPVVSHVVLRPAVLKWAAAFAVIGLLVQTSPLLFLAPPTTAEATVTLFPTRGEVSVSIEGMWHPVTEERELQVGMLLRTHEGQASIVFQDDAVVRMDRDTTLEILDVTDRVESAPDHMPTLALYTGRVWVQGLIPPHIRGLTVATSHGLVTVKEGSVSITEDRLVDVEVYDRRAVVLKDDQQVVLVAGERTQMWEGNILLVKKIADQAYREEWVLQNLDRDNVHQQDIAALQQKRLIESAGLLPDSPLYPVKRIAETVDVLFTFGEEARAQKLLQNAETRLNEAAALLAEGKDITTPLEEYRGTLLALAGSPEDGSFTQFLVQQAVKEATSEVAAALPGDNVYPLKKAVLEAVSVLPETLVRYGDVQGQLLVEALTALTQTVENGDLEEARRIWVDLQPSLAALSDPTNTLLPEVHKEAQSLLSFFAVALSEVGQEIAQVDPELMGDISEFLPLPLEPEVSIMSEEEVMHIVYAIRDNIYVYEMPRSRLNQFRVEMAAIEGHPERGRILRRLAKILQDGAENFPERLQKEIVQLRWQKAVEETL